MSQIIEITDFNAPELDIFARLTEAQLMHCFEPLGGMFIAESPKVIERALDAGYEPVSLLMEGKHIEGQAKDVIARCPNVPVFTSDLQTLTQLTGETGTERLILEESSSFLSSYGRYWDTEEDDPRLSYTIVDVKCPLFYDMLLNEQEQQFMQSSMYSYLPIEEELRDQFDAESVRHSRNNTGDRWLICWDTRIVNLRASWELTEEQIDIIVEQLKP